MPTISTPGLGSGLNIGGIVDSLASINDKQVSLLKSQASTTQAKLSSFGLLKSYVGNLRDIAARLADTSYWTQSTASSSDSASVGVSANAGAPSGSYSVKVSQLAQPQILASGAFASNSTAVGTGQIKIAFADGTKSPLEIDITSANNTLDGVKDAINAANKGVSATVVRDASGARLMLSAGSTGTDGAMTVTVVDDDGNNTDASGLSLLAYPPVADADPDKAKLQMKQTQEALNAKASVNGLDIESATNTLSNVLDGASLTLSRATTAAVTVKVGPDTATLKKAVGDFAAAYNDISKYISQQTKYDETKKTAGALQADRPTLTLQSNLRSLVTGFSSASNAYGRLSDIGLELQKDGTLKVNDTKLSKAFAEKPAEVAKLFTATSSDPNAQGFAARAKTMGDTLLVGEGALASRTKSLQDTIKRNEKQQEALTARTEATRQRLLKQYNALDVRLGGIKSTGDALSQAIKAMQASWSSNSD